MTSPLNSQSSSGLNSLGFAKSPQDTRVIVAMSGGVDSSVVATMLAEEGYDVVGITLQLYDHGMAIQKKGACCAGQDIYDARQVADKIGFPHYVLNYESRFKQEVIDDFTESYLRGETPIPCVKCNQTVKFRDLLATSKELKGDCLATGHYIQRVMNEEGRAELHRGLDPTKDQSYFLFGTTQEQVDFLRFPLGGLEKTQTRALAEKFDLPVYDKPDSQDICFVPEGRYSELVQKLRPEGVEGGEIVHVDGRVLGHHDGIIHYTIGQRRGVGVGGFEDPIYVVGLDPDTRQVIVGPRECLARPGIVLNDINWLAGKIPVSGRKVEIKFRSVMHPEPARVFNNGKTFTVIFDTPQYGIAPGQACVFYDGPRVLGGGWITREEVASDAGTFEANAMEAV